MGLTKILQWKLKSHETAGYVCFVTHHPIVTKLLALGNICSAWGTGDLTLAEGVRGAQLALEASIPGRWQNKDQEHEMGFLEVSSPLVQMAPVGAGYCRQV